MTKNFGFSLLLILIVCIAILQVILLLSSFGSVPESAKYVSQIEVVYRSMMYIVAGILILSEVKSLSEFHIDRFTIVSFIIGAFLRRSLFGDNAFRVFIGFLGVLMIVVFVINKPRVPRTHLKFTLVGIVVGTLLLILVYALERLLRVNWLMPPLINDSLTISVLNGLVKEFSMGAVVEEILFRGFLWGYLVRQNWETKHIIWTQGLIFWLLHISRISSPLTFFIFIPLLTLVASFLTLRSKQLFPAVLSHTIINVAGALLNLGTY